MALPKQVRDQIEETQRIADELEAMKKQSAEEQAAGDEAEPEVPAPEQASFDDEPPEVEEAEGEDEGQPAPQARQDEDENSETYKQRWKSLDGQIASERRRNAELRQRIDTLENMLAGLTELREQQRPQVTEKVADEKLEEILSAQEIEDYGPELIEVMKKAARAAVQKDFDKLREENTKLKQLVGGVGQKLEMSDREKFYARLESKVENWKQLNKDPQFLDWLSQADVYAGESRQALLTKAFQANDAERVARFFQGYLNETAAVTNQAQPSNPTPPPAQTGGKRVQLESLAAPGVGASGSADNTSQSSGRMWKESEIGAFYEDARKGRFKGRETEYQKVERQIQAAMNQGRILLGQ